MSNISNHEVKEIVYSLGADLCGVACLERFNNAPKGFHPLDVLPSFFLIFEDGARLEIMRKPQMEDPNKTVTRTGYIHLAFSVGSKEKVDELTDQLRNDGYEVISEPRTTGDGYYESCIIGIEGNQVEITI